MNTMVSLKEDQAPASVRKLALKPPYHYYPYSCDTVVIITDLLHNYLYTPLLLDESRINFLRMKQNLMNNLSFDV